MSDFILNAKLRVLPPDNLKEVKDKITGIFSKNISISPNINTKALRENLNAALANAKLGKVALNFDVKSLNETLKGAKLEKVPLKFNVSTLNDTLQTARIKRVPLNFSVARNLNESLQNAKLRRVKVAFNVSQIRQALREMDPPPKVKVAFNANNVRPAVREALKGFRPRLIFDVSGLRDQINRIILGLQQNPINLPLKIKNVAVTNVTNNITKLLGQKNTITQAASGLERFGQEAGKAILRFGAFTIATAGFFKLTSAISEGIKEAIDFDRELVRLAQVTGQTLPDGLKEVSDEVTRLAKEYGTASADILKVSVTLAQAGLTAKETKTALEAIAKTGVSATFGDMQDTTEAVIAIMQQFNKTAVDMESVLGSINSVSAKFAVESEDITVAVRRAGAAFEAAGGNFNEFQALFTSVRQTTRESAETIATGFRTIFTRLQRVRTQNLLKSLGVDLQDIEGQFVGPYEAIRRLSQAIKQLPSTDPRFAAIIEELGGFRQISKVIPLIQQFDVAQKALNVALRGGNSLTVDAEIAQQSLAIQLGKVREEFAELIRLVANSDSFRQLLSVVLQITSAMIKLGATIQPLLPYFSLLGAAALGKAAPTYFKGVGSAFGRGGGGGVGGVGGGAASVASSPFAAAAIVSVLGAATDSVGKFSGIIDSANDTLLNLVTTVGGALVGFGAFTKVNAFLAQKRNGIMNPVKGVNTVARQLQRGDNRDAYRLFDNAQYFGEEDMYRRYRAATPITNKPKDFAPDQYISKKRDSQVRLDYLVAGYTNDEADAAVRRNTARSFLSTQGTRRERYLRSGLSVQDTLTRLAAENRPFNDILNSPQVRALDNKVQTRDPNFAPNQRVSNKNRIGIYRDYITAGYNKNQALEAVYRNDRIKAIDASNPQTRTAQVRRLMEQGYTSRQAFDIYSSRKVQAKFDRAAPYAIAAGIGAGVAGGFVSDIGARRIAAGQSSGVGISAAGGLLSGAGTGAALGSVLGVPGATVAGLVGALAGFTQSLISASEELKKVQIATEINQFTSKLSEFSKGRATTGGIRSDVVSGLRSIPVAIAGTSGNDRINLQNEFSQSAPAVEEFFRRTAEGVTTFAEFNKVTQNTLANFSLMSGIPFADLEKQIKAQIDAQNKAAQSTRTYNSARQSEFDSVRELNAFREALIRVTLITDTFTVGLKSLSDRLGGSIGAGATGSLEKIIEGISQGKISDGSILRGVGQATYGTLGSLGQNQAGKVAGAGAALSDLPRILLKIRNQDKFGDSGNFEESFSREVSKYGPEVAKALTEGVRKLIGAEGKEDRIVDAINQDIFGTAEQIGQSLQATFDVLKEFAPQIQQRKEEISQAFNLYAQAVLQAVEYQFDINKRRTSLADTLDEANLSSNRRRGPVAARREFGAIAGAYGSANPLALGAAMRGAGANITRLQQQLSNPFLSVDQSTTLNQELANQKIQYERARKGLEALTNTTESLTAAQKDLEQAEKKRLFGTDLTDTLLFGSNKEKLQLGRDLRNANNIVAGGSKALSGLTEDDKKSLLEFLKRADEAGIKVNGKDAGDVLKQVREEFLKSIGVPNGVVNGIVNKGQSADSQSAQKQIVAITEVQIKALEQLQRETLNIGVTAATQISAQNQIFLQQLFQLLQQNQINGMVNDAIEVANERDQVQESVNAASTLAKRFGINPNEIDPSEVRGTFDIFKQRKDILQNRETAQSVFSNAINNVLSLKDDPNFSQRVMELEAPLRAYGVDLTEQRRPLFRNSDLSDQEILELRKQEIAQKISEASPKAFEKINQDLAANTNSLRNSGNIGNILANTSENNPTSGAAAKLIKLNTDALDKLGNDSIKKNILKIQQLNDQLASLESAVRDLEAQGLPVGKAAGGLVTGVGNRDKIPHMLMPGEFVMNKKAVDRIGIGRLSAANAGGGRNTMTVTKLPTQTQQGFSLNVDQFRSVVQQFSVAVNQLGSVASSFPHEITLNARHTVEVIFNGAEVLTRLQPEITAIAIEESKKAINNMIEAKMPQIGKI